MNSFNQPHINSEISVNPFLKWAGGKRWLTHNHSYLFPDSYDNYIEPFLGSGAVFFHTNPKKAILSDYNSDLIDTYIQIKENWQAIHNGLQLLHERHNEQTYYEVRSSECHSPIEKAIKFIYLNRTCWNGLYRVNLKGNFNVPIGTKKNVILDTDNFHEISKKLMNVELISQDFEKTLSNCKKNDFVFIDPPYTVKHNNNGFVKYNDKLFSWSDQIRLRDCVKEIINRGSKVLLTNADHTSVRDLYRGIGEAISLDRLSVISGSAKARGTYSELIIKCF